MSGGNLLHNLVLFGRVLRAAGLDVNPGRMLDLVKALEHVEIGRRADFYHTARALLVHDRDDLPVFDLAFETFWFGRQITSRPSGSLPAPPKPPGPMFVTATAVGSRQNPAERPGPDEDAIVEVTRTYSTHETLQTRDFGVMSAEEIAAVRAFMQTLAWDFGRRRTRRTAPGRGSILDLRRGLRRNLRYGGELLEWPTQQPKIKPRPLVILADVSGSMDRYTRLLLHFIYSVASALEQPVEAFAFSTRLTRITRQLRYKSVERALREVSSSVEDWSGGTRIGDALKTFNYDWGRRVLGRGAIVMLISDGWDRGDPELIRVEMARLQRSCYRLIWLNPLLGSPRYEPLTRGIQAALPFVDDFLPVHNLVSLEALARHLGELTAEKRPFRKQPIALSGAAFIRRR